MTPAAPRPWPALASMTGVQVLAALVMSTASVLAPAVAPLLGLAPERVGLYAAVSYLAAMLSGLRSGPWAARWGAMRLSQLGLVCCAVAAALAAVGRVELLLLCAALVGLGYGVVNPTAAAVLAHHAPQGARGTFFSIKQSGVPVGVAVAGLWLPLGLGLFGWRSTVLVVGVACAAAALAMQALVRPLEPPVQAGRAFMLLLRSVWRAPAIRRLSLASLAYAFTQQCFLTFLVATLTLRLGWSLSAAAALLAASQLMSMVSRIGLGALADRWVAPGHVLAALGLAMSAACLGLALLAPGTPAPLVVLAALLCSATTMGWNGVFLADLSVRVPRDQIAHVAGGAQFFTFGGGMLGPLLFGEFVRAGGSYSGAYAVLALVPVTMGLWLWVAAVRAAKSGPAADAQGG